MGHYKNYKTEDLIEDISFIQWVINPTEELEKHWESFIAKYPEKKEIIEKAILFVKSTKANSKKLPVEEKERMWAEIHTEIKSQKQNSEQLNKLIKIAASIAIFFSISIFLYQLSNKGDDINYAEMMETISEVENTKVILADDSKIDLENRESNIKYDENGLVVLDEEKVIDNNDLNSKKADEKIAMNQIIVPRGKRANIIFSDGTKLWLNSGSHAIYPVTFSKSKREIYIEGEAYLNVTKDKSKPFIVKTKSMDVKVLGTSFNVKAYSDEIESSVVLVEGSVEIKGENKKIKLSPNQKFEFNAQSKRSGVIKDIDVLEYIGWKDGWLLCNSEELNSVFKKLERYYNVKIVLRDLDVGNYKTSGKLQLKENIEDVFQVISITAPINFSIEEDSIVIYDKKNTIDQKE